MDATQLEQIRAGQGFFAALDQSGGSTPKALGEYGIDEGRYDNDEQMFDLVHAMRTRIVTNSAFDGSRVIGSILFEQTMDRDVEGQPTGDYLWQHKHVVPFLKIDKGLADEADGVQLMKDIDTLDELLERATKHRMFGTKMRSVIKDADERGIEQIVEQQFALGARISAAGLVPILEPEVSIDSPHKEQAEQLLHDGLRARVESLPQEQPIILKVTIPTQIGLYADLAADPRVVQVLALSGGYSRDEACARLAKDPAMIASFSRALLEGLSDQQSDEEFTTALQASVDEVYAASVHKS
jgi:fructose-bisphosphate aldolase class I